MGGGQAFAITPSQPGDALLLPTPSLSSQPAYKVISQMSILRALVLPPLPPASHLFFLRNGSSSLFKDCTGGLHYLWGTACCTGDPGFPCLLPVRLLCCTDGFGRAAGSVQCQGSAAPAAGKCGAANPALCRSTDTCGVCGTADATGAAGAADGALGSGFPSCLERSDLLHTLPPRHE